MTPSSFLLFMAGGWLPSFPANMITGRFLFYAKPLQRFSKIFQDSPRPCQYLPIFAKIRQDSPIIAKAVAPTGVSGVDG
jgi:hypothetical protein